MAALVGGRGGGRADFAQAGGNKPEALDAALESVEEFVRARLSAVAGALVLPPVPPFSIMAARSAGLARHTCGNYLKKQRL